MEEKFWIKLNESDSIMEFMMKGFWTAKDIEAWQAAFKSNVRKISKDGQRKFKFLVHMESFPAQSAEVGAGLAECMAFAVQNGLVKSAHLINDTIGKMQMKRLSKETHNPSQQFSSHAEGLAWLLTNDNAT